MDLFSRIPKDEPPVAGSKMDEALNQLQAMVDADVTLAPAQRTAASICIAGLREAAQGFVAMTEALRATAEATARIERALERTEIEGRYPDQVDLGEPDPKP